MVGHHLDGVVTGQEAVFDAVDSGANARLYCAVPDGVRGHPDSGPMRFVGDRGELAIGVLLCTRRGAV